jgi:hypothetical protein
MEAIFQNGAIVPLGPPPADWAEGDKLVVVKAKITRPDREAILRVFRELEALSVGADPADDERLLEAIREHRKEAKEQARRELGLSE